MKIKYDVVKNQKFDLGRTINPLKCDCEECDFLNCPKKNYAVKKKVHKYTVQEYIEDSSEELKKWKFLNDDLIIDLMDYVFTFPKGTYWRMDYSNIRIELITFSRSGRELVRGSINTRTGKIYDFDMTVTQEKLANRISKAIITIQNFIEGIETNDK